MQRGRASFRPSARLHSLPKCCRPALSHIPPLPSTTAWQLLYLGTLSQQKSTRQTKPVDHPPASGVWTVPALETLLVEPLNTSPRRARRDTREYPEHDRSSTMAFIALRFLSPFWASNSLFVNLHHMHQQPPVAPCWPKSSSKSVHLLGVSA